MRIANRVTMLETEGRGALASSVRPPADDNEGRGARRFLLALGIYFLIHIALRVAQHGALELDEAEQIVLTQQLRLGYNAQPPLYAWLQWLVFQLVGVSHLGLALLKNALLFLLYASVFQTARLLLGTLAGAAISASLVLLLPLGWEAQVDRTHSVLVTTLAAGTLWAYFALLRHPTGLRRAVFGLLIGLGIQSKYNFAIFALGLAAASLIVRQHRSVIWTQGMWITVQVAVLSLLPHASWFAQQVETASGATLEKMRSGSAGYGTNLINGLGNLAAGIAAFISGFWIVLGFVFWPKRRRTPQLDSPEARFFFWLHAAGLGFIVALILCGYLVNIRPRWLQPLLFSLPVGFFAFFLADAARTYRQVLLIALLGGLAMTVTLALRPQLQAALGKHPRTHQPYPELAAEIMRRFPTVQAIAGEDLNVAGNVHFQLQRIPALLVADLCRALPTIGGKVLVLVQEGNQAAARLWRACPGAVVVERGKIGARSASHPRERLSFDYALLQPVQNQPRRQRRVEHFQ